MGTRRIGAAGVVAPAVRVGVFLAGMVQAGDLILEAGAVALLDDGGRDEDQQVALGPGIEVLLEGVADDRDIAEDRDLVVGLGHFVLEQAADGERIAALDEHGGLDVAGIDDRAAHGGAARR